MLQIPLGGGFQVGLGDSNRDGKLDFDFGLRSENWGSSPFGYNEAGAEIGFNTQRGFYAGGDVSNYNAWGASGLGGRVFSDGGFESGQWSNDVFGNYQAGHQAGGQGWYSGAATGGNAYSGNYYGHQMNSNMFGSEYTGWGGNAWSGIHGSNYTYGNILGGRSGITTHPPLHVPIYGGQYYNSCGGSSVGSFMGW